jgi:anion-transporting  ArsA/GET3 family ATPase
MLQYGLLKKMENNLVFVTGKGGVGKTTLSQALALDLSRKKKNTLWVTIENPTLPRGEVMSIGPNLWHLNCDAAAAFEEYVGLKIGIPALAKLFVQNKLMRYLAQAAPGIHELVLLGKIWHEKDHYDHVVVDMPSTGHGLAMFQSVENFSRLFQGGPIHRDAEEMLTTFGNANETALVIVSLPEEMSLRESLELGTFLRKLFPQNEPRFFVNKKFPNTGLKQNIPAPPIWPSPIAKSTQEFVDKKVTLEDYNLRIWRDEKINFKEIEMVPAQNDTKTTVEYLSQNLPL